MFFIQTQWVVMSTYRRWTQIPVYLLEYHQHAASRFNPDQLFNLTKLIQ